MLGINRHLVSSGVLSLRVILKLEEQLKRLTVNGLPGLQTVVRKFVRRNPNYMAIFFMQILDGSVRSALEHLHAIPETAGPRIEWSWEMMKWMEVEIVNRFRDERVNYQNPLAAAAVLSLQLFNSLEVTYEQGGKGE